MDFDWSTRPVYNVIARIPGSEFPDQWVLYGNHHDAWVNGASDPSSGAAALLETARSLSELRKQGWQPKRSTQREFGLIGSTEWVEKHAAELDRKAVAYLNSDSNGKGSLNVGGSHTLERFMAEVERDIAGPDGAKTLLEKAQAEPGKEKRKEGEIEKLDKGGKVNLGEVRSELEKLKKSAAAYESRYAKVSAKLSSQNLGALNEKLFRMERAMAPGAGLPGRDWFKHRIYAPRDRSRAPG